MTNMLKNAVDKIMAPYSADQVAMMQATVDEIMSGILTKAKEIRSACTDDKAALKMAVIDGLYANDPRKRSMAMMIVNNL
jgi:hypothetical protein